MQTPIIKITAKEENYDLFFFKKQLEEFRKEKIYCTLLSGKNNPNSESATHILAKMPLFAIVDRHLHVKDEGIPLNLFNISEPKFENFPIQLKLIYQIITQAVFNDSANRPKVGKNYHFKGGLLGQISYEYKSELEDEGLYQRTFDYLVDKINNQPWPMFHFTCFQDIQIYLPSQKKVLILQQAWINSNEILKTKKFFINYNKSQNRKKNHSFVRHFNDTVLKSSPNPFISQAEIKKRDKKWYIQKVKKIKEYIKKGDCYQVNISRPVTGLWRGSLLKKTILAFEKNPTAFQGEYHFNSICKNKTSSYSSNNSISSLISTSPECLFKVDKIKNNKNHVLQVYSCPIKGTIATSKNQTKDKKNREQLLNSCKDKAELAMITDLIRNDLHRIDHGIKVKVESYPHLESYENIHHLMAIITGRLKETRDKDNPLNTIDLSLLALKYLFPGGSVTGAPKIKSANIIEQLEEESRWAYTGSLGYFSVGGPSQFNILIRSLMLTEGYYYYRVGGGITLLSDPKEEWKETLSKEKTLKKVFLSF